MKVFVFLNNLVKTKGILIFQDISPKLWYVAGGFFNVMEVDVIVGDYLLHSKKSYLMALESLVSGKHRIDSKHFRECLGIVSAIAFQGVLFPGMKKFVSGVFNGNEACAPTKLGEYIERYEDMCVQFLGCGTEISSRNDFWEDILVQVPLQLDSIYLFGICMISGRTY